MSYHGTMRAWKDGCRCEHCIRFWNRTAGEVTREYVREIKRNLGIKETEPPKLKIKPRTCVRCGKVYTPTNGRQKYCSKACYEQSLNERGTKE